MTPQDPDPNGERARDVTQCQGLGWILSATKIVRRKISYWTSGAGRSFVALRSRAHGPIWGLGDGQAHLLIKAATRTASGSACA